MDRGSEDMSVERYFDTVAERLRRKDRRVEQGRMLHAVGLKTAGKFFAFAARGQLVVKLPAARVDELIAEGVGQRCEPRKGRPMREWVCLAPASEDACAAYVSEARTFLAAHNEPGCDRRGDRLAEGPRGRPLAARRRIQDT
jgi:hypothetical protein